MSTDTTTPFHINIITLAPKMWPTLLGPQSGVVGRAFDSDRLSLDIIDLRTFGHGRHASVDDTPYGGGAGMVLSVVPLVAALRSIETSKQRPVYLLGPRGQVFNQTCAKNWSKSTGFTLVCGRYEGVDERFRRYIDGEFSIGDSVLSAGDPAAWCMVDATVRLLKGVLGNERSIEDESFQQGLLEYPHYTRPADFEGEGVPDILKSGDHGAIATWRHTQSVEMTRLLRPDLLEDVPS